MRKPPLLGTGFRYIFTLVVGMTLSMVLAYGTVRLMTRGMELRVPVDEALVDRAWRHRENANALIQIANEYCQHPQGTLTRTSPLLLEYRARIDEVRDRMSAQHLLQDPPARTLLAAADRAASMLLHPGDLALRAAALGELRAALEELDQFLERGGARRRVGIPPTPVLFK